MRPVGLVGRKQIDISTECIDIGQSMGAIRDAINKKDRTGSMDKISNCTDRIDFSNDVGAMCHGDEMHLFVKQRPQIIKGKSPAIRVNRPDADIHVVFGKAMPGACIGLMFLREIMTASPGFIFLRNPAQGHRCSAMLKARTSLHLH